MMTPDVIKDLQRVEMTEFHTALLRHVMTLVNCSRKKMQEFYDIWDERQRTFKGLKPEVKTEQAAAAKQTQTEAQVERQTERLTLPLTRAQIETFVAFGYTLFSQRERFFELLPLEPENARAAVIGETLLQRDLEYNGFEVIVQQFLRNLARFGLGILKCGWVQEYKLVKTPPPAPLPGVEFLGSTLSQQAPQQTGNGISTVLAYQGNQITSVSPYNWFPDPELPISRFQEGRFVASDEVYTYEALKQLEKDGFIAGVDEIPSLTKQNVGMASDAVALRQRSRISPAVYSPNPGNLATTHASAVVTEAQVILIPKQFEVDGKPMGDSDTPTKYLVWIANDERIIRCEPLAYLHNDFCYVASQFTEDEEEFLADALADVVHQLQVKANWFVDSHIASVRRIMDNKLVFDPQMVETDDIKNNRPYIRLREGATRVSSDRWIQQLNLSDVTGNHMADAEALQRFGEIVSGINANSLGQFFTGRRSAQEARNVASGAGSRLKATIACVHAKTMRPLGEQMISNLRSGLTYPVYLRVVGISSEDPLGADYFSFVKAGPQDLVGDFDFAVLDTTLPTERFFQADLLDQMLERLLSIPNLLTIMGFDIRKLVLEIMRLRGIRNPDRFRLPEAQRMLAMQALAGNQMSRVQNVQPGEQSGEPVSGDVEGGAGEAVGGMASAPGNPFA